MIRTALMVSLLLGIFADSGIGDSNKLETLISWMTGSFSSERQAAADSSYYDIRLEMARIWPQRNDGQWLHVEQAAAAHLNRFA